MFDDFQFTLIHRPNISGSYAILLFTVLDFTSITSHIHNWVLFSLWLLLFILSGAIAPVFSCSIWAPADLGSSSFSVLSFLPFHAVHGVLKAGIQKWLAIPFSSASHWANSRRWWGTGRPGVLQSMGSQRTGHYGVTEEQQQHKIEIGLVKLLWGLSELIYVNCFRTGGTW